MSDVAEGLNYLHSYDVIHGDLNGVRGCYISYFATKLITDQSSILVDATGHARITDFGLAVVTQDLSSTRGTSAGLDHIARWVAPEILSNRGTYSKEADVFAFAGVTIEVCHRLPTRG